eukprot:6406577-Pyramimonas_sp.AAC.1
MCVLRMLIKLYTMPRLLSCEGIVLDLMTPMRGVVAGCSFADQMMRSFLIPILDDLAAIPRASVGNVVDDIQMQATGARATVVQQLNKAYRQVRSALKDAELLLNEKKGNL